jgi:hypothetical protein
MAPFRRPGLAEDDQKEVRPEVFRPRNHAKMPFHQQATHIPTQAMFGGDEESVVSSLSAMSDLESLYVESSAKFHTHNPRDQYLLCQRLPGQDYKELLGDEPAEKDSRGSSALLNGFLDGNDDDDDNWEDVIFAATNRPASQRESEYSPKPLHGIDPAEQERIDFNRAIVESILRPASQRESESSPKPLHPAEQESIDFNRAIIESILQQAEDEKKRPSLKKEPRKEKRPSKMSTKKVAPSDGKKKSKKPKKTGKENPERIKVDKKTDRHVKNENELKMGRHIQKENASKAPISPRREEKAKKERGSMWSSSKGLKTPKRTVR